MAAPSPADPPDPAAPPAAAADQWTVQRILQWTAAFLGRKNVDQPRLSAELLLAHVLATPRLKLYTDFERVLKDGELKAYRELVQRACKQEPIAYLTGTAHFFGLEFQVNANVLIPRPDTETLVEHVLQLVRHDADLSAPRILDLCTGSGCIAAALAKGLKEAVVVATEKNPAAAALARANLERLGLLGRVSVEVGDLFEPVKSLTDPRPFDLIVSNPPYIRSRQMAGLEPGLDASVRDYEPHEALDGGADGLALHRRILQAAPAYMTPRGRLLLEIAFDQGPAALALAAQQGELADARILKDSGGRDRVLSLRRPG